LGFIPRALGFKLRALRIRFRASGCKLRTWGHKPRALGLKPWAFRLKPGTLGFKLWALWLKPRALGFKPKRYLFNFIVPTAFLLRNFLFLILTGVACRIRELQKTHILWEPGRSFELLVAANLSRLPTQDRWPLSRC
jgi:hypothetical protein